MKNVGEISGFFIAGGLSISQVKHFNGMDWFWITLTVIFVFSMIIIGGILGIFIQDILLPFLYKSAAKKINQWNGKKMRLKQQF